MAEPFFGFNTIYGVNGEHATSHLFTVYSGKPSSENIMGLAHSLGCATVAADDFFKLRAANATGGDANG